MPLSAIYCPHFLVTYPMRQQLGFGSIFYESMRKEIIVDAGQQGISRQIVNGVPKRFRRRSLIAFSGEPGTRGDILNVKNKI